MLVRIMVTSAPRPRRHTSRMYKCCCTSSLVPVLRLRCATIPFCVSPVRQDRLDATCEREVSGREVLLFRSDEQQRELPVSLLVWRASICVVSVPYLFLVYWVRQHTSCCSSRYTIHVASPLSSVRRFRAIVVVHRCHRGSMLTAALYIP